MTSNARLLIIDDDPGMFALVQGLVDTEQIDLYWAKTLSMGMQMASQTRADVILLDHLLPDGDGINHIADLIQQDRLRPILYVTAQSGSNTAIEAIKQGAFDYLSKPIDFALLRQRIAEAIEYRQLTRSPVVVSPSTADFSDTDVLVGKCRAMQEVYKGIGRLASLPSPVLIEGEVGTGKEMIARAIHQHATSKDNIFCKLSSEDFDDQELVEELFGDQSLYESVPSGRLFECDGGTLLLEEIGGVSLATQSKLLRFLQEPVIGNRSIDVRIVVTASVACKTLVDRGQLRSDLYYFLSPYVIRVPPLRERQEDFELLVAHFMQRLAQVSAPHHSQAPPRVSPTSLNILRAYDWPGNVAQLKSVLQSVLVESRGTVLATDALNRALDTRTLVVKPSEDGHTDHSIDSGDWNLAQFVQQSVERNTDRLYEEAIHVLDQQLLRLVLQHTKGNQAAAARILGMTRTSLRRKIAASKIQLSNFNDLQRSVPGIDLQTEIASDEDS